MQSLNRSVWVAAAIGGAIGLAACGAIPTSGPSRSEINASGSGTSPVSSQGIQVVDVTDQIARQLYAGRKSTDFATTLGDNSAFQQQLGVGDVVEVSIWEAPPATLFGGGMSDVPTPSGVPTGARLTKLPTQVVDGDGNIHVPFVGAVKALGRTPSQLQVYIAARLKSIAHDPQVLVQLARNETSYVTVVGDVSSSTRMQLSARGERVLDALAAAGGSKQPISKTMIQVTRGNIVALEPLDTVIRDPRQNVPLKAGDVVTALFQPYSFTAFGATGKNEEINFEAQGITLAQALARAGGLQDSRSDAQGVFIFRLEDRQALAWPNQPVRTTANGKVPVIYHINLKDPDSFFVAQSFMMDNKDVLYVSNAPVAELQKVLNLVFSVAYPIVSGVQTFK
ncbi:polysaccharide biosynthesis/export family protein [Burkholderia cenocepacia]|uniref:Capsular biosynthesis protein n=1 Tax=Burkholderia cenocepacia TaxID=95486 RepID=A0A1V2W6X6_9BURK|nr:polysaccharide biosynthesis/export family protein [Burkholderia cenocepacia]MBR7966394.1 polysaccharide export protein [Burkholderia cenocepacia]MBR8245707.1 polysaccharide export protein [Burkholderia cenocepacia]MBR8286143.1 polysaccharide export protein [Burkholderia cenocepacia]MBR8495672.1 polysaccharide export protein [Burkholderia cenocepacia]MCW5136226.1 polysaccharide export protein [Burkholderia cenocepacia]